MSLKLVQMKECDAFRVRDGVTIAGGTEKIEPSTWHLSSWAARFDSPTFILLPRLLPRWALDNLM